jgi:Na+-transporting methylmalonyl-CoA/oxaloacetate decarboxylase gamma subunit
LKIIARSEGLKIALDSLVMSVKVIGKAFIIAFLFFLIFAIIFVNLLKGKFNKCTDTLGDNLVFEHVY